MTELAVIDRAWTQLRQVSDTDWQSETYVVSAVLHDTGVLVLRVRAADGEPINDWRHLQAIKNVVAGVDREAVEVFAALPDAVGPDPRDRALYVAPASTLQGEHGVVFLPLLAQPVHGWADLPDPVHEPYPPVQRIPLNPAFFDQVAQQNLLAARGMRAFGNGYANGYSTPMGGRDGETVNLNSVYLSWKHEDRSPVHDVTAHTAFLTGWAATRSDVGGWGFELYPAEGPGGRLVDAANQWHLWCRAYDPDGGDEPVWYEAITGWNTPAVPLPYSAAGRWALGRNENDVSLMDPALSGTKARQRPWEPGIPTGPSLLPPPR